MWRLPLGLQLQWTAVFYILNKTIGLRVTAEEEIAGLDSCEHGLASAYADFIPMMHEEFGEKSMAESVPVVLKESAPEHKDKKMTKVEIVTDQGRLDSLKTALEKIGVTRYDCKSGYGMRHAERGR